MEKKPYIKAHIIVDLGFGDSGKGITTDFIVKTYLNPIVIRFSGGQQCGHGVMVDGTKHIHSNFGSGTLRGAPTYFSEHATFYPATIARELKVLREKGFQPKLSFHPLAKMTTPFDVFANRFDSQNLQNGSCGLGIGKTMKRDESPFKLYAIDLLNIDTLKQKLGGIKDNYYAINESSPRFKIIQDDIDDFMEAITDIAWDIQNYDYLLDFNNLIFEGSQGILLDMDHGVFPNVTYANTTSKNAHEILDKLKVHNRNLYYVTRCYSTRHGSGPFVEEELNLINNEEEINVFNKYQKEFKVASINYDLLNHALRIDSIYSNHNITTQNLVVTCLDQLPDFNFDYSKIYKNFNKIIESYSPDNKDFKIITNEGNIKS